MKTLLLGMGNPILRDDAVGIRLAVDIGRRLGRRRAFDLVPECSVGGLELLPVIQGYDRLVAFDSIVTEGGTPGTWYRFTAADLGRTQHLTNVHDTNFATALELGRRLGLGVPAADASHIFAVEILDNLTFDEQMSPALERAYPVVADAIFAEVQALLAGRFAATSADAARRPDRRAVQADAPAARSHPGPSDRSALHRRPRMLHDRGAPAR